MYWRNTCDVISQKEKQVDVIIHKHKNEIFKKC